MLGLRTHSKSSEHRQQRRQAAKNAQRRHAAKTRSEDTQQRHAAKTRSEDVQRRRAAKTCSEDVQRRHAMPESVFKHKRPQADRATCRAVPCLCALHCRLVSQDTPQVLGALAMSAQRKPGGHAANSRKQEQAKQRSQTSAAKTKQRAGAGCDKHRSARRGLRACPAGRRNTGAQNGNKHERTSTALPTSICTVFWLEASTSRSWACKACWPVARSASEA
jgi:hypothetical protein